MINERVKNIKLVVGKMTYDPISMKWNGNESELDEFEKKVSQKAAKPKLIQQERSALPEKIGEMVFDPVALVWRGNEDNVDAHIFDDIDELATAAKPIYEYNLGKLLTDLFHKCEVNHKLLMGSWFSPVLSKTRIPRDSSKSFLYEIRAVKL